jgi:hypothetical protein
MACSNGSNPNNRRDSQAAAAVVAVPTATPKLEATHTWFDATAATEVMGARADFDTTEAAALAETDRIIGKYQDLMLITPEAHA